MKQAMVIVGNEPSVSKRISATTRKLALRSMLLSLLGLLPGCTCNDSSCSAPFVWNGVPASDNTFSDGTYQVSVQLDDGPERTFMCELLAGIEPECSTPTLDREEDVYVSVEAGAIGVQAGYRREGRGESSCEGAKQISIRVHRLDAAAPLVDLSFSDIEYERMSEASDRCGFADLLVYRETTIESAGD